MIAQTVRRVGSIWMLGRVAGEPDRNRTGFGWLSVGGPGAAIKLRCLRIASSESGEVFGAGEPVAETAAV